MNIEEMLIIVRRDLRDEDAERWSDAELERHIAHAIRDYSAHRPLEKTATLATTAGSRDIDIASIVAPVRAAAVEYPVNCFPRRFQPFSLWGSVLTLLGDDLPDGSAARLYYGAIHELDAAGSTVPLAHEDIIAAGAGGYAAMAWSINAVNRVNAGGTSTPGDYLAWGREQLAWFRAELRRLSWNRRVRPGTLFYPARPAVSNRTVSSPGGNR